MHFKKETKKAGKATKKTAKKAPKAKARASAQQSSQEEAQQTASIEDFNSSVDTSFFYTSDKYLNAIDDDEVIGMLIAKYPEFSQKSKDSQLKKCFLQILDDDTFIEDVLKYFNLSIFDFFKIIYKSYSALFNTLFIKKVKDKIKSKRYARI